MVAKENLIGATVSLRQIELGDCNENYVRWLNDPDVVQYLETKWSVQTLETIKAFVRLQRESNNSILFAIIYNLTGQHIGNIKIGPIHPHYKHADISYFIGEKSLWGKGCTTEAIGLISRFGFKELKLHRIEAGAYSAATGSWKALERNGFKREAVFREQVVLEDRYMDIYRYGILETEYRRSDKNGGKDNE